MSIAFSPFIDVSVNADWSDWKHYPNGRPNPLYSKEATEWNVSGLKFGFITLSASQKPCWAAQDAMPLNWALPLANDLHASGLDVDISFGGSANKDISCVFSIAELVSTYQQVIDGYRASGLDFDLENGFYNISNICEALKIIQQKNPHIRLSFTLPVMPSGLAGPGLSIVQNAISADLNFVINGMAMDYYDPQAARDMGKAAISAAISIYNQLKGLSIQESYSKIAITPMIGLNDDKSMFSLQDTATLAMFAKQHSLSFLSMWSFNRDNPSSYSYVDLMTSSNPDQKKPGEYCNTFVHYINH